MEIRNRLKEIRMKEYTMDRIEFAEFLNVNIKTYYSWENGNRIPSLDQCLDISNKLNISVNEIWYKI